MTMTSKNDQPRPDVRLHVRFEDSPYSGYRPGERYAHVYAVPVILARDKYGDQRWDAHDPDSYSVDAPGTVRAMSGLKIRAQLDDHNRGFYAYRLAYSLDEMDLRKAERAVAVLRRLDKRMTALASQFGHPRDLAAFLAHLAVALVPREPKPFIRRVSDGRDWEGTGYRSMDPDALRWWLDDQAAKWRDKYGITVSEDS
jgi:hypothetical protein